jgi:hypothetical protein
MASLAAGINQTAENTGDLAAAVTAPITPIAAGGIDVAGGAEVQIIAANDARFKVTVSHAGADGTGTVWLGLGQTAAAGSGIWLDPGMYWEELQYTGAVRVRNAGSDPVRVTWVEWGTA